MAILKFNNVGITAMSACVPKQVFYNKDLDYLMPKDEVEKVIKNIGISERRIAPDNVCASDLCYEAAKKLFEDNHIDPQSIDVLLFMSQTADYRIPATAPILQHRLGLPTSTMAMDLSLGCSGFVYALSTAFAYTQMDCVKRVLLLDGETFSKIVNRRDKVDWPLYGDGATATLIEKGDFGESIFMLNSDGSGANTVMISDAMRNPITKNSLEEKEIENNNFLNGLQVYMDGMDVFNFAMRVVPKSVKDILKSCNLNIEDINWLVFHQANKFMTDFFVKYLKFPAEKVPYCIHKYGNTSSTSVPLTIVSELKGSIKKRDKIVMSGFGAGLSWGTVLLNWGDCNISDIVEL